MPWLRIDEQKPEEEQEVFYWFGAFDKVYAGKFVTEVIDDVGPTPFEIDYFYDEGGFLGDDVTYWMPRNEGDPLPEHPSKELKKQCRYHPVYVSEEDF